MQLNTCTVNTNQQYMTSHLYTYQLSSKQSSFSTEENHLNLELIFIMNNSPSVDWMCTKEI